MGLGVPIGRLGKMKRGEAAQLARLQGCARRGRPGSQVRNGSAWLGSAGGAGGRCVTAVYGGRGLGWLVATGRRAVVCTGYGLELVLGKVMRGIA